MEGDGAASDPVGGRPATRRQSEAAEDGGAGKAAAKRGAAATEAKSVAAARCGAACGGLVQPRRCMGGEKRGPGLRYLRGRRDVEEGAG